jgi:hypothetical protein
MGSTLDGFVLSSEGLFRMTVVRQRRCDDGMDHSARAEESKLQAWSKHRAAVVGPLTQRPLFGALASAVQARRVTRSLFAPVDPLPWSISLGWETEILGADELGENPAAAIAASGREPPSELFLGGTAVDAESSWQDLERSRERCEQRCLVGAPFRESTYNAVDALPRTPFDFERFRLDPAFRFTHPTFVPINPERLREYQLMRWKDPKFFFETVLQFQESVVGWGAGIGPLRPTMSSYQCLYYSSLIADAVGDRTDVEIVEIGGGYGNLARTLALTMPQLCRRHTIVDLPEMHALQQWFLTREFPGEFERRFRFLGAGTELPEADVVVATHSLSELDPSQVNHYLRAIGAVRVVVLVMQRRFFGTNITYDWMLRSLIASGYEIARLDPLSGQNTIAVVLTR